MYEHVGLVGEIMMSKKALHMLVVMLALVFIGGCATLPKDFERPQSYAYTDTQHTALGKALADQRAANPGKSGFHLLGNGLDAFVARAVLAHFAERSIDVQYYLYHDDLVGRLEPLKYLKTGKRGA